MSIPKTLLILIGIISLTLFPLAYESTYYDASQRLAFGNGSFLIMGKPFLFPTDIVTFGNGSVNIGSTWFTSTCDIILTAFHEGNWVNYTVSSAGTQQICNGSKPLHVWIDGEDCANGNKWSYSGTVATVTGATGSVALYYDIITTPGDDHGPGGSVSFPTLNFYAAVAGKPVADCLIRVYLCYSGVFVGSWVSGWDGYCTPRQLEVGEYNYHAEGGGFVGEGNFTHSKDETVQIALGSPVAGLSFRASIIKILVGVLCVVVAVVVLLSVKGKRF